MSGPEQIWLCGLFTVSAMPVTSDLACADWHLRPHCCQYEGEGSSILRNLLQAASEGWKEGSSLQVAVCHRPERCAYFSPTPTYPPLVTLKKFLGWVGSRSWWLLRVLWSPSLPNRKERASPPWGGAEHGPSSRGQSHCLLPCIFAENQPHSYPYCRDNYN